MKRKATAPDPLDRQTASMWASWFGALGDPTRVQILHVLALNDRAMSVGEITDAVDVGQSTVSHHLATLADVRFVMVERVGTSSHWSVNRACLEAFPTAAEILMGGVPVDFPPDDRPRQDGADQDGAHPDGPHRNGPRRESQHDEETSP